MKKKKIAIIGSGEMAVIIVENARKMNLETHTFSNDMHDRVVGLSDAHHNISIFDIDAIVDTCRKQGVLGVLPTTELTISVAAEVAERLSLNGMSVRTSKLVTDKSYIRKKATAARGIKQPGYNVWTIGDSIPNITNYPVVVKPTSMGGKRGVSVAASRKELLEALDYAQNSMPGNKRDIIIEDFIEGGKEYSVESLSFHGRHMVIQITEKITSGPPHCVELGHLQPAKLPENLKEKVEEAIINLLEAAGIDNTSSHTEIKIVNEEVYLIELNARSGGDHIAYPLTELSTGYPYIKGVIEVAMDCFNFPDKATFKNDNCGIIFIVEQTKGFKPLYEKCVHYDWLYKRNVKTDGLKEIVNNQAFDTNYFIFTGGDSIPTEIAEVLQSEGIM